MTNKNKEELAKFAQEAKVDITFRKSGIQRSTAIIAGKTYGGVAAAKSAITREYLKQV